MTINENLDIIDDILDAAWSVPLSGGRCVVDIDKLREVIDDIRLNIPSEIKQAKQIVENQQTILAEANKKAEYIVGEANKKSGSIIKFAETHSKKLVDTSEIVRQSNERAKEIIAQTNAQNRELKKATTEFIENILRGTEAKLNASVQDIKSTRQALKSPIKMQQQHFDMPPTPTPNEQIAAAQAAVTAAANPPAQPSSAAQTVAQANQEVNPNLASAQPTISPPTM